jgi:hypothetical protein
LGAGLTTDLSVGLSVDFSADFSGSGGGGDWAPVSGAIPTP